MRELGLACSWAVLLLLGGGVATATEPRDKLVRSLATAIDDADLSILVLGNSHTQTGDPIGKLEHLLATHEPEKKLFVEVRRGSFLTDIAQNRKHLEAITAGAWDYIILQAQKYSSSGKYSYPTDSAVMLGRLANAQGTQVIMFPEWPRRGNTEEGPRIHRLHQTIAEQIDARVAPVGLAWIKATELLPKLRLHAGDGNHSTKNGARLTAAVLFCTITGLSPEAAIAQSEMRATKAAQAFGKIAWESCVAETKQSLPETLTRGR